MTPVQLFQYVYHMTHCRNLPSILEFGILSLSFVREFALAYEDISDPSVQRWRDREEPCYHRRIHEYVPLYVNPRNPMLYRRKEMQDELLILEIDSKVLDCREHVFTDGNAASGGTTFSRDVSVLTERNTAIVLSSESWIGNPEGKRVRCAEVLVYPDVPAEHIVRIACSNEALAADVRKAIRPLVEVDRACFFD